MPKFNIKVVDLYHGEEFSEKDFKQLAKDGIVGVIHKATQGITLRDRVYKERKKMALDSGLLWGAYHFASNQNAKEQVNHFLEMVGDDKDMLLALDYEPNRDNTMSFSQAKVFVKELDSLSERKCVIYSGHLIKEQMKVPDQFLNSHRLWLAQYGNTVKCPPGWENPWLWQFTGDGIGPKPHTLVGIKIPLDLNHFYGTDEELKDQWAGEKILKKSKKNTK